MDDPLERVPTRTVRVGVPFERVRTRNVRLSSRTVRADNRCIHSAAEKAYFLG